MVLQKRGFKTFDEILMGKPTAEEFKTIADLSKSLNTKKKGYW